MRILAYLVLLLLCPFWGHGNGLRIWQAGTSATGVRIWVAWQNGWHDSAAEGNHDAVWLFAKAAGSTGGRHLHPKQITILENALRFQCQVSSDGTGAWVYPTRGRNFLSDSVLLQLDFKEDIPSARIRGIEMVYIPRAAFYLGDGASNKAFSVYQNRATPFLIKDSAALPIHQAGGVETGIITDSGHIEPTFPTGFKAYFCQKYEVNQSQWADFLSSLGEEALAAWYPGSPFTGLPPELAYKRSGLRFSNGSFGVEESGSRAAAGLNWKDLLAFLDWAALRPLSESEFEKCGRGPLPPQAKEYAWGIRPAQTPQAMSNDGSVSERPTEELAAGAGWANHGRNFGLPQTGGPIRQGFGATGTSGRVEAGCGYYGCFELSGNVWEICVGLYPINNAFGLSNGDGALSELGRADATSWQNLRPIVRGGAHNSLTFNDLTYPFRDLALSDRFYDDYDCTQRRNTTGGRGGRGW